MADEVSYKILDVVGNVFTIRYRLGSQSATLEVRYDGQVALEQFIAQMCPFKPEQPSDTDHSEHIGKEGAVVPLPLSLTPPPPALPAAVSGEEPT